MTDIFSLEYVSDPQISPDGNRVIYVRNFKDIMTDRNLSNLWIVNFDGSGNRPLTTGNQNDSHPRWSHKGDRIIFKSDKEDKKTKLYMMWMDTREVVPLTNTIESPQNITWSRDDRKLAFTMFVPNRSESLIQMPEKPEGAEWNVPPVYIDRLNYRGDGAGYLRQGNQQIFTLSTQGGTPRQLTFSEFNHGAPSWSAQGDLLYFSANYHKDEDLEPRDSEVYQLRISDGDIQPLTSRYGPDQSPAVSPDGSQIAYTVSTTGFRGIR